ncbi:MAG: lasso peptide [Hassallia sp. WJT32-NPBG1]|jgi:hypothetical protein|nr:lasso peptide [Hassallia sp. WJT32-NPBG1]
MKSTYNAPKLTVHGDVAKITQILGQKTAADFLIFNGGVNADAAAAPDQGSRDLICSPDKKCDF